jgi:cysteinyl-tRNA synthetase
MADRWLWDEAKGKLSKAGLAQPHMFDIHGGGIDLVFPHHENEVAQSRCANGTPIMAQVWMHNGFLQVEGEKMAKSAGNFVTVHELLEGWQGYAWPGEALRFNMLRTHYRQPLDWTLVGLDEAHKILWEWCGDLEGKPAEAGVPGPVLEALLDDLNTPKAIAEMHKLHSAGRWGALRAALNFFGFSGERGKIRRSAPFVQDSSEEAANAVIAAHHAKRHPAAGTTLAMPVLAREDEIANLIGARNAARAAKNFKEADRIRGELEAMGITLKDAKDPKTGELVTTWEVAR